MPRRRRGEPRTVRTTRFQVRLPFSQLEAWITTYHDIDPEIDKGNIHREGQRQTVARIARLCDTDRTNVHRWLNDDLTYFAADRAAAGLGVHAENIWPGFSDLEPYEYRPRTGAIHE